VAKVIKNTLQGVTKQQVRWQKCVDFVNERLGMAVGRLFIRENFQKESKETVTLSIFSYAKLKVTVVSIFEVVTKLFK